MHSERTHYLYIANPMPSLLYIHTPRDHHPQFTLPHKQHFLFLPPFPQSQNNHTSPRLAFFSITIQSGNNSIPMDVSSSFFAFILFLASSLLLPAAFGMYFSDFFLNSVSLFIFLFLVDWLIGASFRWDYMRGIAKGQMRLLHRVVGEEVLVGEICKGEPRVGVSVQDVGGDCWEDVWIHRDRSVR